MSFPQSLPVKSILSPCLFASLAPELCRSLFPSLALSPWVLAVFPVFSLRLSVCSWCFLFYSDSSFHPVCVMFSLAPSVSSVRSCLCTQVFPLSPDSLSYIFSVSLRPVSESPSGHVSCWYFNSFCYSHICLPHTGYPDTPS